MVKHIVIYTLKNKDGREKTIEMIRGLLEPLVGQIPGLLHLEIRANEKGPMDYALYSEFESREALANYAVHPLHLAAKEQFFPLLDQRYSADYEV